MFINSPDKIYEFDLCIIGSGHAALPIALNLDGKKIKICIIPGGKSSFSKKLQDTYVGTSNLNIPLDKYRLKIFGGTSKIWGGRCIPFKPIDFVKRKYMKMSGWPISLSELDKYYEKASDYLDIGKSKFDRQALDTCVNYLIKGLNSKDLVADEIEKFSLPTDFAIKYKQKIKSSSNIFLFKNSFMTSIQFNKESNAIDHINCQNLSGKYYKIFAKNYVLATGGIENARILLHKFNFNKKYTCGNKFNNVGKYFMTHFSGIIAKIKLNKSVKVNNKYEKTIDGVYARRRLSISESTQKKYKIFNFSAFLHHHPIEDYQHKSGLLSLIFLLKKIRYFSLRIPPEYSKKLVLNKFSHIYYLNHLKNILYDFFNLVPDLLLQFRKRILAKRKLPSIIFNNNNEYYIHYHVEHEPVKTNTVSLISNKDNYNLYKTHVNLNPTKQDLNSIIISHKIIDNVLRHNKLGRLIYLENDILKEIKSQIGFGGHLIGTTRMAKNYKDGVVDSNCKVFEMKNLYVSGSSIFPTSGEANPGFTIVALALRLSDHLFKIHNDAA